MIGETHDTDAGGLVSAEHLAAGNKARFPNESAAYHAARDARLVPEIEARRAAALRRALPPGGAVPEDYGFIGEHGPITLSRLFGDKDTLCVYSYMFGPA